MFCSWKLGGTFVEPEWLEINEKWVVMSCLEGHAFNFTVNTTEKKRDRFQNNVSVCFRGKMEFALTALKQNKDLIWKTARKGGGAGYANLGQTRRFKEKNFISSWLITTLIYVTVQQFLQELSDPELKRCIQRACPSPEELG